LLSGTVLELMGQPPLPAIAHPNASVTLGEVGLPAVQAIPPREAPREQRCIRRKHPNADVISLCMKQIDLLGHEPDLIRFAMDLRVSINDAEIIGVSLPQRLCVTCDKSFVVSGIGSAQSVIG